MPRPVPQVRCLEELNARLEESCREDLKRRLRGQRGRKEELLAEELRLSHRALGEITGAVSSDELLGKIFSEFCIGK